MIIDVDLEKSLKWGVVEANSVPSQAAKLKA